MVAHDTQYLRGVRLQASVIQLIEECFPAPLCRGEVSLAGSRAHVASSTFREAPLRARTCAQRFVHMSRSDNPAQLSEVDCALALLYSCCAEREPRQLERDAFSRLIRRTLFITVVLLEHAALIGAPNDFVAVHAERALVSLLRLAVGAVSLAQLQSLERRLLLQLGASSQLLSFFFRSLRTELDADCEADASPEDEHTLDRRELMEAQAVLVLRWVACSLRLPSCSPQVWPSAAAFLKCACRLTSPAHLAADVLRSSLGCLQVDLEEQCTTAAQLLDIVACHCERLLAEEDPGEKSAEVEHMYELYASLLPHIKLPLLHQVMHSSLRLAAGCSTEWQRERCMRALCAAVGSSFNYYRKHFLVRWLMHAEEAIDESEVTLAKNSRADN